MITVKQVEQYVELDIEKDGVKIGQAEISLHTKHLYNFSIYAPYQNQGYGQKALQKMIEEYNIKSLTVATDNERAKHIYQKLGFEFVDPKYYEMECKKYG